MMNIQKSPWRSGNPPQISRVFAAKRDTTRRAWSRKILAEKKDRACAYSVANPLYCEPDCRRLIDA